MFGKNFGQSGKENKLERDLRHLEEQGLKEPDNLNLQVRMGEMLVKAAMKERAIKLYRETAEKFAQRSQFPQAMALNKVIQRLNPSEEGEQWHTKIYNQWTAMGKGIHYKA